MDGGAQQVLRLIHRVPGQSHSWRREVELFGNKYHWQTVLICQVVSSSNATFLSSMLLVFLQITPLRFTITVLLRPIHSDLHDKIYPCFVHATYLNLYLTYQEGHLA
jgi:hypothetical protein